MVEKINPFRGTLFKNSVGGPGWIRTCIPVQWTLVYGGQPIPLPVSQVLFPRGLPLDEQLQLRVIVKKRKNLARG